MSFEHGMMLLCGDVSSAYFEEYYTEVWAMGGRGGCDEGGRGGDEGGGKEGREDPYRLLNESAALGGGDGWWTPSTKGR